MNRREKWNSYFYFILIRSLHTVKMEFLKSRLMARVCWHRNPRFLSCAQCIRYWKPRQAINSDLLYLRRYPMGGLYKDLNCIKWWYYLYIRCTNRNGLNSFRRLHAKHETSVRMKQHLFDDYFHYFYYFTALGMAGRLTTVFLCKCVRHVLVFLVNRWEIARTKEDFEEEEAGLKWWPLDTSTSTVKECVRFSFILCWIFPYR